jgi:hypothetical protein
MADVLIAHCNHLYFDRKQVRKMQPYPPLQALLAASSMRAAGFDVALFDSTLQDPKQGFREALARHRPRLVFLRGQFQFHEDVPDAESGTNVLHVWARP